MFGAGCQGVLTGPAEEMAQGCCSYGAHFTGADDVVRVEAAAVTLDATDWQFIREGRRRGVVKTNRSGEVVTRMVGGACIFLNRPDFVGGPGARCTGLRCGPVGDRWTSSPTCAGSFPCGARTARRATGRVTSTISEWGRAQWGAGGAEFHWWCTEAPEAFGGPSPSTGPWPTS